MVKLTNWRITCPPQVRHNQMIAMEIDTLFILRQNGPLAFSVQDMRREKPFEVRIGDPHTCSCRCFKLAQDLCPHICWIILKKFEISYADNLSFQRGISDQEFSNWFAKKRQSHVGRLPKIVPDRNQTKMIPVPRRRLREDDSCAICLEQFFCDRDRVTYCKYSCGNIVHLKCIRTLMKHANPQDDDDKNAETLHMLKCPICRGNFNTLPDLRIQLLVDSRKPKQRKPSDSTQLHDTTCTFCLQKPIRGNLYRCLECNQISLCGLCLEKQDFRIYHGTHDFAVKKKSGGPWRRLGKVEEHLKAFNRNGNFLLSPYHVDDGNAAKNKNLLEFSKGFSFNCYKSKPDNTLANKTNAIKTDRHFVKRNYLCAVCTDAFEANTHILATACGHYFHADCMEEHLNDSMNEKRCPLDNIQIQYSPYKQKPNKWAESKARKDTEINLGPLEVRVSRMHLEQRPKESKSIATPISTIKPSNSNAKTHKQRIKVNHHKQYKPINVHEDSSLDERLLSTKVNPLMTILMSPHLKQFIEQEEKREQANDANSKRKSLNKIKVKSLEFPDECNTRAKLQKSRSTPSPSRWVQKTLKCKIADGQTRSIKRCDL